VVANGYIAEVDRGDGTTFHVTASPVQFDEQPPALTRAPEHAEHTELVLLDLGRSWDDIAALKDSGVIT
jgi:crotonobetainyl-CoA:carnitine CoA-transferase CaiB-like acyl-CoA transferase